MKIIYDEKGEKKFSYFKFIPIILKKVVNTTTSRYGHKIVFNTRNYFYTEKYDIFKLIFKLQLYKIWEENKKMELNFLWIQIEKII